METVAVIMGAIQGVSDAISNAFKVKMVEQQEQTNRVVAVNTHNETSYSQLSSLITNQNAYRYVMYFVLFGFLAFLVYKKKVRK